MDKNDQDHLRIFNRLTKIETRFDSLENQVREMRQDLKNIKTILLGNGRIGFAGKIRNLEDKFLYIKYVFYGIFLFFLALLPIACESIDNLITRLLK